MSLVWADSFVEQSNGYPAVLYCADGNGDEINLCIMKVPAKEEYWIGAVEPEGAGTAQLGIYETDIGPYPSLDAAKVIAALVKYEFERN